MKASIGRSEQEGGGTAVRRGSRDRIGFTALQRCGAFEDNLRGALLLERIDGLVADRQGRHFVQFDTREGDVPTRSCRCGPFEHGRIFEDGDGIGAIASPFAVKQDEPVCPGDKFRGNRICDRRAFGIVGEFRDGNLSELYAR